MYRCTNLYFQPFKYDKKAHIKTSILRTEKTEIKYKFGAFTLNSSLCKVVFMYKP